VHVLAVLLTANAALIDVVERSRSEICTAVMRNASIDDAHQLTMVGFNPNRQSGSFVDFLGETIGLVENRQAHAEYNGVVVLYDYGAARHIAEIHDGIFAAAFDGYEYIEKRENFLIRSFGRLVKNRNILMGTMHDKTRMEAAILPAKNFDSTAFKRFLQLCQEEALEADFQNRVVPALTAVTQLRGPKRRSTYPTKYFRDERPACFQYGHETHSSFETGGDHTAACTIRGLFRLGVPLESQRHFNVTSVDDKTRISGEYSTCHLECIAVVDKTHLNMFSNDFLK
jgi:hypothetical protein